MEELIINILLISILAITFILESVNIIKTIKNKLSGNKNGETIKEDDRNTRIALCIFYLFMLIAISAAFFCSRFYVPAIGNSVTLTPLTFIALFVFINIVHGLIINIINIFVSNKNSADSVVKSKIEC